jgi:hypothetical protein
MSTEFPAGTAVGVIPADVEHVVQAPVAAEPPTTPEQTFPTIPAPAQPVSEALPAEPTPSAVPEAARARLSDRLKKRRVKDAIAQFDDGEQVYVKGLQAGQMDEIRAMSRDGDDPSELDPTQLNNNMLRLMCFDPENRTEKVFEDWTDEELSAMPMSDLAVIMQAISIVNGSNSEPGKESPSTGALGSSSPSPVS